MRAYILGGLISGAFGPGGHI